MAYIEAFFLQILRGHDRCIDINRYDLLFHKISHFHLFPPGL